MNCRCARSTVWKTASQCADILQEIAPVWLFRQDPRAYDWILSRHPPAPHARHRLEPRAPSRDRADARRPHLAAVRDRGQGRGRAGRLAARRLALVGRWHCRAGEGCGCCRHPLHCPVPQHAGGKALRRRGRSAQSRQPHVPRDQGHPRCLRRGYRRADRRRARSLYQPRAGRVDRRGRLRAQ